MPGLERAAVKAACTGVMGHGSQRGRGAERAARQYVKPNFTPYSIPALLISIKWRVLQEPNLFLKMEGGPQRLIKVTNQIKVFYLDKVV